MKNHEHKTNSTLEKLRGIFFQIGLIIACGLTLVAFEWTTYTSADDLPPTETPIVFVTELPPVTYRDVKKAKITPPKVKSSTILKLVEELDPLEKEKDPIIIDEPPPFVLPVEIIPVEILPPTPVVSRMPHYKDCASFIDEKERKDCTIEVIHNYLNKNLKTPRDVIEMGDNVTAYVYFEVNKKGGIQNVKVQNEKRISASLTKEVIRVINSLPTMIAGKEAGKKRVVFYSMPIGIDVEP